LETATKRLYEGMFLVDSAQAAADWDGTLAVIETILKRADADVVSMRKWGERRLAYEINHQTRGTYILCYFKANGQRIAGIEKDVQLSEKVMRVLILGTEKRPAKMLEADIAGVSAEAEGQSGRRRLRSRPLRKAPPRHRQRKLRPPSLPRRPKHRRPTSRRPRSKRRRPSHRQPRKPDRKSRRSSEISKCKRPEAQGSRSSPPRRGCAMCPCERCLRRGPGPGACR